MPKDQKGKFTPIKGKPSGSGKEGLGLRRLTSNNLVSLYFAIYACYVDYVLFE
ncbi:hypothetical protein [Chitinophaga sp. CF418]|uniref:hypothetical protein n=1 Tax=Chitinophaga sp. CF418 TaxID=1855287 RepID=UPI0009107EFE|nr:hypothetical protein [Chitinophaga sp. CF418]SHL90553.1 hypothetical protein SAMN05216311_10190 [Chitinophaga sp. CF418]